MHETTKALLRACADRRPHKPSETGTYANHIDPAIDAWRAAGCPDAPFVPMTPGCYYRKGAEHPVMVTSAGTYAALVNGIPVNQRVTDDGLWLGPVAPWGGP